jgi:tetratricopeptide (TPR) repeat protein
MFCAGSSSCRFALSLWTIGVIAVSLAHAAEPHWIRASSSHFLVVANADQKQGQEVIARFEQMRSSFGQLLMRSHVNIPEPVEIIALRSEEDYSAVVPAQQGPLLSDAFFIPSEDRCYFVLNLARSESWRAISYDFAKLLLNYNYPPVQAWFDEGFAQYFSSLRLGRTLQIGGEPISTADRTSPFIPLLSSQPWSPTAPLLAPANQPTDAMFAAQSWLMMHYLINQNKLEQTGTYFDLVENQKLSPEQAIQQAYSMTAAQLDQAVRSYYQSLVPLLQASVQAGKNSVPARPPGQAPSVASDDEIGSSVQELPEAVGQALVAEMVIHAPEHRSQAINQLNSIANQPKLDNSVAHRALAFAHLQNGETGEAAGELAKAAELDPKDPWLHYYLALIRFRRARASETEIEGLANIMQDLRAVLDWMPEFAEADNMLGMARLEGGGLNSAMQVMRAAMQLSPRNQQYQLNMAKIYVAAKKWDAADAMLKRLASSSDPKIAQEARQQLDALPTLEKYGVVPQPNAGAKPAPAPAGAAPGANTSATTQAPAQLPRETKSDELSVEEQPSPQIDRRPVQYAKGRLISVDCSQTPVAIVTFSTGAKSMKLRTENYKALLLINIDQFSCNWANRAASVNYKAGGKSDGDLVSLELH